MPKKEILRVKGDIRATYANEVDEDDELDKMMKDIIASPDKKKDKNSPPDL